MQISSTYPIHSYFRVTLVSTQVHLCSPFSPTWLSQYRISMEVNFHTRTHYKKSPPSLLTCTRSYLNLIRSHVEFTIIICESEFLFNSICSLNAVSISDDSSLLAGSFNDSNVRVWTLSPKKLCPLKSYAQLQQIPSLAAGMDRYTYGFAPKRCTYGTLIVYGCVFLSFAEDIMERLIDFR